MILGFLLLLIHTGNVYAYVGPGAGFALVSSFFFLFAAVVLIIFSVASWPLRAFLLVISRRSSKKNSKARRVIVVGLDGMDPKLASKYMEEGFLPNFSKLNKSGTFDSLKTTYPPLSPVGWSTFATGVNPGKHRIFDFFTRDKKTFMPVLSSTATVFEKKKFKIGFLEHEFVKTSIKLLRKSTSMWKVLGQKKSLVSY